MKPIVSLILIVFCLILMFSPPVFASESSEDTIIQEHYGDILSKFKNCKEANIASVSNVSVPPGYKPEGWKRSSDRDKDGIACEKK